MGEARSRRRGVVTLLAAGAAVVVAAGVAVAVRGPAVLRIAAPAHYLAPVPGFVAVSRDGRTLTAAQRVSGLCNEPVTQHLVATESAGRVALYVWVRGHRVTKAQASRTICTADLVYAGAPPSVRLRAPLGARAVVQSLGGARLAAYGGGAVATPHLLPRGCVQGPLAPAWWQRAVHGDLGVVHPGVRWDCTVEVPFRPRPGVGPASQLRFGQWLGHVGAEGWPVASRTSVHGQPATIRVLAVEPGIVQGRSISWHEAGQTFVVTSSSGLTASVGHDAAVLSAARLRAIAQGLEVHAP